MRYFPQGDEDLARMLHVIGVSKVSDLFRSIPSSIVLDRDLELPPPRSELELRREMGRMAARNASAASHAIFLGAGAYNHYVPAAVGQLLLRSEFYTSYTPYQPEISQGTLQAIFEYQTLVASLTELEISNASLYDGASATAEGILTAQRSTRRNRVVVSEGVHPHYRRVVRSYVRNLGIELVEAPIGGDGRTDASRLDEILSEGEPPAAVIVQNPNFFGCVEDLETVVPIAKRAGALVAVAIAEALSLGLLHGPGRFGADLAVGEGQSLGVPLSFGGPFLGFMAAAESLMRQMPGRLVGETRDGAGRSGYVLTLATREQHIRREKATSNICTNQGLMALAATIYMCMLGKDGMREVALQNRSKADYARRQLASVAGCSARFDAPFFNEFVMDLPVAAEKVSIALLDRGTIGGLPLGRCLPDRKDMDNAMLFCVTEMNTKEQIDQLAADLAEIVR